MGRGMNGGLGGYLEDQRAPHDQLGDDALDPGTIARIEELHSTVLQTEAEQRFGLFGGRRSAQLEEAEAAERAFLAEHDFATYNDYRLRIRRSTVSPPAAAAPPRAATEQVAGDSPREQDQAPEAKAITGVAGNALTAAPPWRNPGLPELTVGGPLSETQPPPHIGEFQTASARLLDQVRAEAASWVALRIETLEAQSAELIDRATREAAELVARANGVYEMTQSLANEVTRRAEALMDATSEVPAAIAQTRDRLTTVLNELRTAGERPILHPAAR
jgi:hypothetical protein